MCKRENVQWQNDIGECSQNLQCDTLQSRNNTGSQKNNNETTQKTQADMYKNMNESANNGMEKKNTRREKKNYIHKNCVCAHCNYCSA